MAGANANAQVAALPNAVDDRYLLLQTDAGAFASVTALADPASAGFTGPALAFDFRITGLTPGASATVSITLPPDVQPGQVVKGPADFAMTAPVPHAITGDIAAGLTLTYTLTDGGPLDQDATANGEIADPIAIEIGGAPTAQPMPAHGAMLLSLLMLAIGSAVVSRTLRRAR